MTSGDFGRLWVTLGDSLATLGDSLETFGDRGFKKATIGDRSAKNRRKRRLCSDDAGTMGDTVHYYLSTLRRHVPKITRQVEDLLMTEVCHLLSLLFILVSKMDIDDVTNYFPGTGFWSTTTFYRAFQPNGSTMNTIGNGSVLCAKIINTN